jgi:hypothetical protein
MLLCYYAIMLLCYYAIMLLCYYGLLGWPLLGGAFLFLFIGLADNRRLWAFFFKHLFY